jgi:predicted ATPase
VKGYASQEIERNYLRARELSHNQSGSEQYFLSVWGLWVFHLVRGPLATACDLAEQLLSLAEREQDPDLLIRAHESVGSTYSFLGRFEEAKTNLLAAKSHYDPTRHRSQRLPYAQDPGITARIILARTLWILGEVDQVEALSQEAIGMARQLEHPFTLAFALATVSWIYSTVRDARRTLIFAEEAVAISTKYSFEVTLAWATSLQGWALAENGEEQGLSRLVKGLSATQAAGASLNNTFTLAQLAEIYMQQKRVDEGLGAVAEAEKLVLSQGERCWQAELLRLKGELLLEQSEQSVSAAEQCFTEALKIAQEQHANMLELRAAASMARLLPRLNNPDTAKRTLSSVLARFGEHGADLDLMKAQAILNQLSISP